MGVTNQHILRLVKEYLDTEELYMLAVRKASITPTLLTQRDHLRDELLNLIKVELHNDNQGNIS